MALSCKVCAKRSYSEYCVRHKPRKPIRKLGKQYDRWKLVRDDWYDRKGHEHNCYICGKKLNKDTITLDHVIPKSNASNYSNRHLDSNLQPCCWSCNGKKGSKH